MASDIDFRGTPRFQLRRRLGAGTFGIVYEAEDRERGEVIALKALRGADSAAIYRLKKEFRTLADVTHRNLVSLYELIAADETWFFTMELVDGQDFVSYVRASDSPVERERRLRAAIPQLVAGVAALHASHRLHRDLKPSNILVGRDERVVILDFGISAELQEPDDPLQRTVEAGMFGSPGYMAPEQFFGEPATEATDWYSVGCILYEALTGSLPFTGSVRQLMAAKNSGMPAPVQSLAPDAPADLADLAMALLATDPSRRLVPAKGAERRALQPVELLGREPQIAALDEAFRDTRHGPLMVFVSGPSGIGKSTLVQQFLERVSAEGAVVLSGRCYARESVPHKALDGVVDSLSRYLRNLTADEVEALLPRHVAPLLRTFPVLGRVDALERVQVGETLPDDPIALRRIAFAALQELLRGIASRHPLVIAVDDLQWADEASARALESVVTGADAPRALTIVSFRSDEAEEHAFLREALMRGESPILRHLRVEPLGLDTSIAIVRQVLPDADDPLARQLAEESAGSPFLAEQLARHVRGAGAGPRRGLSLAAMLEARIEQHAADARSFLRVLAVAGHPLDTELVRVAAQIPESTRALVQALETDHLLKSSAAKHQVEMYHDRIRETIAGVVATKERRAIHGRLARAFEAMRPDDADALYEHWLGAEQPDAAAKYAVLAARKASASLAFDRAASLYRSALELLPADARERATIYAELASALTNVGHTADAGEAYLAAARLSDAGVVLDYQSRAAEQFLMGGYLDRGVEELSRALAQAGLSMPPTPRAAALRFLLTRLLLKLRGHGFTERRVEDVPAPLLRQIDACWAGSAGFGLTQPIMGASFQIQHLLLALRAGEPHRIARAFAVEAGYAGAVARSIAARPRVDAWRDRALELAARVNDRQAVARAHMAHATGIAILGDWLGAAALFEDAEEMLLANPSGMMWDIMLVRSTWTSMKAHFGDLPDLAKRLPAYLRDASERGNVFISTQLRLRATHLWLARNDPRGARADVEDAMAHFAASRYYLQTLHATNALALVDMYEGDAESAWRRIEAGWPALQDSMLMRVRVISAEAWLARARAALFRASQGIEVDAMLRDAERSARRLGGARVPWSEGMSPLLGAGVAFLRGDRDTARARLQASIRTLEPNGFALYAAAARRRLGQLLGGSEGAELVAAADRVFRERGVENPSRLAGVYAPGIT